MLTREELAAIPRPESLDAKVAAALGLKTRDDSRWCQGQCVGMPREDGNFPVAKTSGPHFHSDWKYWKEYPYENDGDWENLPYFSSSWDATGPLIEKYGILLYQDSSSGSWQAYSGEVREFYNELYLPGDDFATGPTPLVAVCHLILTLHAAGKL